MWRARPCGLRAWCPRQLHRLSAESGRRPTRQPFCSRHRRNATRSLRLAPRCSLRPVVPAGTPALPCYPMKPSREGPRRVRAMQDAAHRRRRRENSNHRVTLLASHQDRRRILRQSGFRSFQAVGVLRARCDPGYPILANSIEQLRRVLS